MSTQTKLANKLDIQPVRIELEKRKPCFHCSRSLQYNVRLKRYIGFVVEVTNHPQVFHQSCIDEFISGVEPVESC